MKSGTAEAEQCMCGGVAKPRDRPGSRQQRVCSLSDGVRAGDNRIAGHRRQIVIDKRVVQGLAIRHEYEQRGHEKPNSHDAKLNHKTSPNEGQIRAVGFGRRISTVVQPNALESRSHFFFELFRSNASRAAFRTSSGFTLLGYLGSRRGRSVELNSFDKIEYPIAPQRTSKA